MEATIGSTVEETGQDHPGASAGGEEEEEGEDSEEGRGSTSGEVAVTRGECACEDVLVRSRLLMLLPFCCSSVKAVDKREGAGAHNWGTMKDDIETYDFLVNALGLFQFEMLIGRYTLHTLVTCRWQLTRHSAIVLANRTFKCSCL